jgi:hypothetical protein
LKSGGPTLNTVATSTKPWCWEGNIVCFVTSYLAATRWQVKSVADTAKGEPGADIVATRADVTLIVEVKGYPSTLYERGPKQGQKKRVTPSTQARHWMSEAILTAMLRQAADPQHRVAIAFPDFPVYANLLARLRHSLRKLGLIVIVVSESGSVVIREDPTHTLSAAR